MAENYLDNLHNDQAETKSIIANTPNGNFAAQPVEPEQSTQYTLDELQNDLATKRGVQDVVNPTTEYLNPDTELTEEEKTKAAAAPAPKKSNIMNFATGDYLDDNVSDRQKADYISANRAFQRIIDLYDSYENPTMADIEAAIGEDAIAFNKIYGSRGQNWANAFGAGSFGQLTKASMAKINDLVNTYRTRQGAEKQAAYDQAVAEHENQYKVKYGDNEIAVDKEFSDNIKSMFKAAMRSAASVNDNSTPEQVAAAKAEQAKIANDIKAALEAKGVAFDPNVAIDSIDDIVNAAAGDYITKDAVGDILDKAMARKEYTQQEEKSLDDRLRERAELKELVDARNRAREIQRAKSRTGMVGIAALIGDMIRASEGAPVSQRDYQRIYDNLDAQAQANINNYNIRMQKIKDDANRARMAQQAAAAKAAKEEADRNLKLTLEEGRNKRWADKLDNDLLIAQIRAGLAAGKSGGKGGTPPDTLPIRVDGKDYYFRTGRYKAIMRNIAGVLNRAKVVFNIKNKLTGEISDTSLAEAVARYLLGGDQTAVGATGPTWAQLPRQEKEEILSILRGSDYTGTSEPDETPTTTTTPTPTTTTTTNEEPDVPEFE